MGRRLVALLSLDRFACFGSGFIPFTLKSLGLGNELRVNNQEVVHVALDEENLSSHRQRLRGAHRIKHVVRRQHTRKKRVCTCIQVQRSEERAADGHSTERVPETIGEHVLQPPRHRGIHVLPVAFYEHGPGSKHVQSA